MLEMHFVSHPTCITCIQGTGVYRVQGDMQCINVYSMQSTVSHWPPALCYNSITHSNLPQSQSAPHRS